MADFKAATRIIEYIKKSSPPSKNTTASVISKTNGRGRSFSLKLVKRGFSTCFMAQIIEAKPLLVKRLRGLTGAAGKKSA